MKTFHFLLSFKKLVKNMEELWNQFSFTYPLLIISISINRYEQIWHIGTEVKGYCWVSFSYLSNYYNDLFTRISLIIRLCTYSIPNLSLNLVGKVSALKSLKFLAQSPCLRYSFVTVFLFRVCSDYLLCCDSSPCINYVQPAT